MSQIYAGFTEDDINPREPLTISGDTGFAAFTSNNINLVGGAGVTVTGDDADTLTIAISGGASGIDTIIPNTGINVVPDGSGNITVVTANTNVKFNGTTNTLTQDFGLANLFIGVVGTSITSGGGNISLGQQSMLSVSTGNNNVQVGRNSLDSITSGINNISVGNSNLLNTNGSHNIAIGGGAGVNYNSTESSNILIGLTVGVAGESHVCRIGNGTGTGDGQITQAYLSGVINTSSGRVVKTTVPGAYPYTTLISDFVVLVDTSSARTINLVATPVTGTTYIIKDNVGTAAANNITITPAAGTIDGVASAVISTNWGSINVVYQGTSWRIY